MQDSRPWEASVRKWVLPLLLVACAKRAPDPLALALADRVAAADRAWEERATFGFEPAARVLDEAEPSLAHHPEILWRRVRVQVGLGLVAAESVVARRRFADARAIALACVARTAGSPWGGVDEVVVAAGRAGEELAGCAAWGALAWSRWAVGRVGEASALDARAVAALVDAGRRSDAHRDTAAWAEALWALEHGATGVDARAVLLDLAARLDDGGWVAWADAATGVEPRPGSMPRRAPTLPEERAALDRLGERREPASTTAP